MKDLKTFIHYSSDGIEVELTTVDAKKLSSKERNDLPDADFAYIEPGGKKVDGKTEPRSLRKFPIPDADHVRSALSYLGKSDLSPEAKKSALKKIKTAAKKFGVTVSDSEGKTKEEWDKIDKKELKRDTKKEKEEHEKDAVKDDAERIKKLKKGKPSEKKKAETRDLKKDQKRDEKSEKKESTAQSEKQKAAKEKFMEMIRKKKKGGDDKKDDDKKDDDKKDDDKKDKRKARVLIIRRGSMFHTRAKSPILPCSTGRLRVIIKKGSMFHTRAKSPILHSNMFLKMRLDSTNLSCLTVWLMMKHTLTPRVSMKLGRMPLVL